MEGAHCYPPGSNCDPSGTTLPAYEYANAGADCSVIAGYVYRGAAMPELDGHLLFGDFCGRWIDDLVHKSGSTKHGKRWATAPSRITSFGRDGHGELYVTTTDGRFWLLAPRR
jgi:hypothetical protein